MKPRFDRKAPARYKIVCFYTEDNEYLEHAEKLKASLERLELNYELTPVKSIGDWELNCAAKAKFIQSEWEKSDLPVVWIDADATVEQQPTLFNEIECDFAVHKWDGWQFGSGTLYFAKTPAAKKLIDQWVFRCEADPITWDQTHLQSAWCDISAVTPLTTAWLPRSYLQIYDRPEEEPAVIKHWQASRRLKADGRSTGEPQFRHTTEGVRKRTDNQLWRTPEEAFWIIEGTEHIIPNSGTQFPEGFDVAGLLRSACGDARSILEVGCGVGRIASLFRPDEYLGVDINPAAVAQARTTLPQHKLRIIDDGMAYPEADATLLYTVLLHISDKAIDEFMANIALGSQRIVIAELMDSRWRRDGDPPVFNRDPEQYILMMQKLNYRLVSSIKQPYKRYDKPPFNVGRDSRLTALTFDASP